MVEFGLMSPLGKILSLCISIHIQVISFALGEQPLIKSSNVPCQLAALSLAYVRKVKIIVGFLIF